MLKPLIVGITGVAIALTQAACFHASLATPRESLIVESSQAIALSEEEQVIYQQINQHRQSIGLSPLKLSPSIVEQARQHSQSMAKGRVPFSHQGFEQRIKAIGQEISYRRAAENIAVNQGYSDPATQAVQGWLASTSHRQNIEGQFNLTGVGVSQNRDGEYYFTQIFVLER